LESLHARHRHKLRIAAKKLHYATKIFASVFQKKNAHVARNVGENSPKAIQETVGVHNDIDVHERFEEKYSHPEYRDGGLSAKTFAFGMLAGHELAKVCMANAFDALKRLKSPPHYWRWVSTAMDRDAAL
jgi:CHAD domain-containing protein